MGRLFLAALSLAVINPAAAQTMDRLYLMDCGHNAAKDQARWSPGVNVGQPIEMSAHACSSSIASNGYCGTPVQKMLA
jgi:N-acyl homoserine lactone hydrolase